MGPDGIVIAIDGPAGAGKSSTATAVAAELGYRHLDSGAFYRAITLAALRREIPAAQWEALTADELRSLGVAARPHDDAFRLTVEGEDVGEEIRSATVNSHVSRMASMPEVRRWLLGALREAGRRGGLVADGRDVGTVVFPDAELKVFLIADPQERARRRLVEQGTESPSPEEIRAEAARLSARDEQDSSRAVAPLLRAPDAVLVDTTSLSFEAQVSAIVRLARERLQG